MAVLKTNHGDIEIELLKDAAPKTVQNFIDLAEGTKVVNGKKIDKPFYNGLIFHRVIKGFMIQGGCPLGTGTGDAGYKFDDEISAKALGLDKEKAMTDKGPSQKLMIRSRDDFARTVLMPLYPKLGITSEETFNAKKAELQKAVEAMTIEDVYTNMGYKYEDGLKSVPALKGFVAMANSGPNTNGSQFFINLADTPWLNGKHTVFGKIVKGQDVVEKIGAIKTAAGDKPEEDVKIESVTIKK
ncbi:MAG: peptidylprolyl isomerase [Lentisphaeraceae bacterium]|nr:peptidylprolyl isomerase [Lentisphaeraceae bacterium]